jgi:hypothetical protein
MEVMRGEILPKATDRLPLGTSSLAVSPICLGISGSPETVVAAYEAGINFFFLSADLHWPKYEGLRRGLEQLFSRRPSTRDHVVVGVVSYLEEPLFHYLQFNEVIDAVPGLERVDLLIAGGVSNPESLQGRLGSLRKAREAGHVGSRAIGASFHHRGCALLSLNQNGLDMHYVRFNAVHRRAIDDFFPYVRPDRAGLLYGFKSTFPFTTEPRADCAPWQPKITDYYRFALTHRHLDGLLCRLSCPREVEDLVASLEEGPLTPDELAHIIRLSSAAPPATFMP